MRHAEGVFAKRLARFGCREAILPLRSFSDSTTLIHELSNTAQAYCLQHRLEVPLELTSDESNVTHLATCMNRCLSVLQGIKP